jgi:hypothetical protein
MKVSDLIQALQKCMGEAGDRDVIILIRKNINDTEVIINLYERDFSVSSCRWLDMRDNKIFLTVNK